LVFQDNFHENVKFGNQITSQLGDEGARINRTVI